MFNDRKIDKLWQLYNGMLLSNENERCIVIGNYLDDSVIKYVIKQ